MYYIDSYATVQGILPSQLYYTVQSANKKLMTFNQEKEIWYIFFKKNQKVEYDGFHCMNE